ncbi:hypothetical protein WG899_20745 [Paucibacter sp. AS339]|uniref:hypothetical protein n=1 Tax=Paucibacter hankyongi TaxID=3133434 RepID=UPI00309FF070
MTTAATAAAGAKLPAAASQTGATEVYLFSTDSEPRTQIGRWLRLVYAEAFKRMDMSIEVLVAPTKRTAVMLERGESDGEMLRAPVFGAAHPELIAVDAPLMVITFSIYATRPMPNLTRIEDLADGKLVGIYRRGVLGCENALLPAMPGTQLTSFTSTENGLAMLARGRADYMCDVSSAVGDPTRLATLPAGMALHKLFDIGNPVPLQPYVQARHTKLAKLLATTLRKMMAEGLVDRMWKEAEPTKP